jgi:hypothetical protein
MKTKVIFAAGLAALVLVAGCESVPPGAERGPQGTIAYDVLIEASPPGARIEANGQPVGNTPVRIKIFGDKDGTFHDFGSYYYMVRALPLATNQFPQVRMFGTGRHFTHEDRVPDRIFFDMNQPMPANPPGYPYPNYGGPPGYYGPPPPYYGPYYGPPGYYGPGFRFYFGGHRNW